MSDLNLLYYRGLTSQLVRFNIKTAADNSPATGILYTSAQVSYFEEGASSATVIGVNSGTLGTWGSGDWAEVGNGIYEFGVPDAVFASVGDFVDLYFLGSAGVYETSRIRIQLIDVNLNDGIRAGILALPNAQPGTSGGLIGLGTLAGQLNVSSGAVRVQSGTSAGQILQSSGQVSVYQNSDKNGYALSQSFPTNFALLSINGSGQVAVGTNADKTGYSLTQAFPSNFSSLAISVGGNVTAGTVNDKTGYTISGTVTTFDALNTSLNSAHGAGSWLTGTGFSTLTQADVRTAVGLAAANLDTQLSSILNSVTGVTITTSSPVANAGEIRIQRNDDYYQSDGRGINFSFTGFTSLVGATVVLDISGMAPQTGTVLDADSISFDLPRTETSKPLDSPLRFKVYATLASSHVITLAEGSVILE